MTQKPFVCLGCGDGSTGLYCLNCGEKLTAPKWTGTPPTVPGWYWWRHPYPRVSGMKVEIRRYYSFHIKMLKKHPDHHWAGPLPEPKEP